MTRYRASTSTLVVTIHLVSRQVCIPWHLLEFLITGVLHIDPPFFDLHTEPSVSPPEFSIICRTHGGPATAVDWLWPDYDIDEEESQVIVDTSHNSVYRNELRVRGRHSGRYHFKQNARLFPYCDTLSTSNN